MKQIKQKYEVDLAKYKKEFASLCTAALAEVVKETRWLSFEPRSQSLN